MPAERGPRRDVAAVMPGVAERVAPQLWIFEHMIRMERITFVVIVVAICRRVSPKLRKVANSIS